MSLPIVLPNGLTTNIPGIYDSFSVSGSLPAPVSAGRSVFIFGESEQGLPGAYLDLRLNFFTNFADVYSYYGAGTISDAARMLLQNQPSPAFGGSINRLYIYKTNATQVATKTIVSPQNYGTLQSYIYGEEGNYISSQILAVSEMLATKSSISYLPSSAARSFNTSVSGILTTGLAQAALDVATPAGTPATFVTSLNTVTGLSATGGTSKTPITGGTPNVTLSAAADLLTVTVSGGTGGFGTAGIPGDTFVIPYGTTLAGTGSANAGVYLVTSWSNTSIVLRHIKSLGATSEASAQAFDLASKTALAAADYGLYSPLSITETRASLTGTASDLELSLAAGDLAGPGMALAYGDLADSISTSSAAIGSVQASAAGSALTINITGTSFSLIPSAGDVLRIPLGSALAGSTLANVGLWVVQSANASQIVCNSAFGLTGVAVASTLLSGATSPFQTAPGFVSNTNGVKVLYSAQEAQVYLNATKIDDGTAFPATKIGGTAALDIGYYAAGATACTVSIDANRVLTIVPTSSSNLPTITVNTNKYPTLQALATFLNTQTNVYAAVSASAYKTLPTSVLDMVSSVPCLGCFTAMSANAQIKKDYYDWTTFFANNTGLLAFVPGTLVLQAGLPAAESVPGFLAGAELGGTTDASIQAALDAALKVDVRMVVPLFSRDARYDVEDGNTDPSSSYSIDATVVATLGHVTTASSSLFKRERIGEVSFHGSYADTLTFVAENANERLQMMFQDVKAQSADGSLNWQLPWMASCAVAAGRAQSVAGTSMLRKSFLFNDVRHPGNTSLYTDQLSVDFDPEDQGQLNDAITAGLVVFRAVPGFGVRMESPDLTTRSRVNDPTAFVYERTNILFACDETRQTIRSALDSYIGNRMSDTPLATVKQAASNAGQVSVQNGSMVSVTILSLTMNGRTYAGQVLVIPTETLEAIVLDVVAEEATTGT